MAVVDDEINDSVIAHKVAVTAGRLGMSDGQVVQVLETFAAVDKEFTDAASTRAEEDRRSRDAEKENNKGSTGSAKRG